MRRLNVAILDGVMTSDGIIDLDRSLAAALVDLVHSAGGLWIADEALGNLVAARPNSLLLNHLANSQAASWFGLFLGMPIVHTPRIGVCRTAFGTRV